MISYKSYNPRVDKPTSIEQCVSIIEMFAHEHWKRECAMSPRNEKWSEGLLSVSRYLKQQELAK